MKRARKYGAPIAGRSKTGMRKRRCAACHRGVWYVHRLLVPLELRSIDGARVPLAADALACDACLELNPDARKDTTPLDVAVADENVPPRARRQTCRTCKGQGCRRCDGRGSVEVADAR